MKALATESWRHRGKAFFSLLRVSVPPWQFSFTAKTPRHKEGLFLSSETQGSPEKPCAFVVPFFFRVFCHTGFTSHSTFTRVLQRLKALLFISGMISAKEGIDCEMDPSLRRDGVGVGIRELNLPIPEVYRCLVFNAGTFSFLRVQSNISLFTRINITENSGL